MKPLALGELVAAIVDRVTFNAHIIETGTSPTNYAPAKPPAESNAPTNSLIGISWLVGGPCGDTL
jgi:hypothetical protein